MDKETSEIAFDRRATDVNAQSINTRMSGVEGWCEQLDFELKANTRLTQQVHTNTQEIVELFKASKEMFEFLARWSKRFAIFAKYVSYVAGAIAAVWAVLNLRR
jgi:hypothetical protein